MTASPTPIQPEQPAPEPKPECTHTETDHSRVTLVNLGSEEAAKKLIAEMEKDGSIRVSVTDPRLKEPIRFQLFGFTVVQDAAKVDVLYFKPKPDKREVVYYLTDHPDAPALLSVLKMAFPHYNPVNMEDTLNEMAEVIIAKSKGELNDKPGVHPEMAGFKGVS